jgi:hypothetical protein
MIHRSVAAPLVRARDPSNVAIIFESPFALSCRIHPRPIRSSNRLDRSAALMGCHAMIAHQIQGEMDGVWAGGSGSLRGGPPTLAARGLLLSRRAAL